MALKLKLDSNGVCVLLDGKPVYTDDDGKDVAFDANQTVATIARLNGEARSHRERAETAETKLKGFDGIEDPAAAIKALNTVKNLDDKKLVDAGKVDEVKAEVTKAMQKQVDDALARAATIEQQYHTEVIGGVFSRSKYLADKVAIPADLVQARFGSNFKMKDGKPVAYDATGKEVFSRSRPGELADPDEALEILIDAYPQKDSILKGEVKNGGGANNNGGAGGGGKKPELKLGASLTDRTAAISAAHPELTT
jgi:hypothetical protein